MTRQKLPCGEICLPPTADSWSVQISSELSSDGLKLLHNRGLGLRISTQVHIRVLVPPRGTHGAFTYAGRQVAPGARRGIGPRLTQMVYSEKGL